MPGYDYAVDRPVHLTICAHDKKPVFGHDAEAEALIAELSEAAQDLEYKMLCYCLMPDHLHVIVSSGTSGVALSKFLNIFKGRTTAVFRKRFGISTLWQKSAYDHVIRAGDEPAHSFSFYAMIATHSRLYGPLCFFRFDMQYRRMV